MTFTNAERECWMASRAWPSRVFSSTLLLIAAPRFFGRSALRATLDISSSDA
jgi:hypothetical protein